METLKWGWGDARYGAIGVLNEIRFTSGNGQELA
jgi:hypothetical protein